MAAVLQNSPMLQGGTLSSPTDNFKRHNIYRRVSNSAVLLNQQLHAVMLQVGACIVNKENKIVGIGYNGMPNGCSDDELPWQRTCDNWLETKYPYGQ